MDLILASTSERRRDLLREYGHRVHVVRPAIPEPSHPPHGARPEHVAESLSYFKARSVVPAETGVILAADTVVALGDRLFGKPRDEDDARSIMQTLGGTTHKVITGVTLLDARTGRRMIRHDSTAVTMRRLSEEQLDAYLATRAWEGKAGAYGIQDDDDPFVERIEGSYTNVVGLPMELLAAMLEQWGGLNATR